MPLNPGAVGATTTPVRAAWTSKDALLYAVGVGAGVDELAYTTDNTAGIRQQLLPTFPAVVANGFDQIVALIGDFDMSKLVHGQEAVTIHRPLGVDGSALSSTRVAAMYDKVSAAVVVLETTASDEADGQPLWTTRMALFIRGAGGWGGDRGPSGAVNVPPDRDPDHVVSSATSPDQALIYRLSGDRNPLHSDPAFAARGGFDRPILHGLCTFGFTGRALLHTFCGGESDRFHHIEGRFTAPVLPGETLTISMWATADGEAAFVTRAGDQLVIDQGLLRHS